MHESLARLSEVDWSSLRTAHGTAEHVPAALEALVAARSPEAIRDAYWRIDNTVVLQGTVYESACAAVPFIVEILRTAGSDPLRVAAYDLLIEIVRGVPDPAAPIPNDQLADCRAAIAAGASEYAADLRAQRDPAMRRRALDLLTSVAEGDRLLALLDGVETAGDEELGRLLERARAEA
jgi:hypothetical protein